jgi:hypothetical protein
MTLAVQWGKKKQNRACRVYHRALHRATYLLIGTFEQVKGYLDRASVVAPLPTTTAIIEKSYGQNAEWLEYFLLSPRWQQRRLSYENKQYQKASAISAGDS